MLLDTSFIIDLLKGMPEAITKAENLRKENIASFISTVSVYELWQSSDETEKAEIDAFFKSVGIIPLNEACARIAGDIQNFLRRKGAIIQPEDAMIAGTAMQNNQPFLTRNVKHFARIAGLQVESY